MRQAQTFDFHFKNVEKQFESYQGINVKLRSVHVSGTNEGNYAHGSPSFILMSIFQIPYSCNYISPIGRRREGQGSLGSFLPYAPRYQ